MPLGLIRQAYSFSSVGCKPHKSPVVLNEPMHLVFEVMEVSVHRAIAPPNACRVQRHRRLQEADSHENHTHQDSDDSEAIDEKKNNDHDVAHARHSRYER